ncbi:MAG: hypothetical protein PHT07_07785 [Paludibacter sp.]|nr:hypothetical protein [Paludibacter sp.]
MDNKNITFTADLLRKAEERSVNEYPDSNDTSPDYDNLKLLHELQVYQLELEIQNAELLQSKEKIDHISEKYRELYDFAPLGYFTLTKEGEIVEQNHYGSQMVNNDCKVPINNIFRYYVIDTDKPVFDRFLEKVFTGKKTETCIVGISLEEKLIEHFLLSGMHSKADDHCLIAAIDISERLKLEKETNELHQFNSFFVGREIRMVELKHEINELLNKAGFESKYPV